MIYVSLLISIISIGLSVFTIWKTLFEEKMKYDINVLNVCSPEHLVHPKAGMIYIELVITNKSSLPLVLVTSKMEIHKTGMRTIDLSTSAFLIDTLISTHKEQTGTNINRVVEQKSNGLPVTILSKHAAHCIVAYPAPGILGVTSESTDISVIFTTNRDEHITIESSKLKSKMITLENFLKGRVRIA